MFVDTVLGKTISENYKTKKRRKADPGELSIRASVIIELRKIYNCSYDAFFVGLDNPVQQPIVF